VPVLLTGATGLIGSRVLDRLLADGESVRVLVRPATLDRPEVASELRQHSGVDIVAGDLTDETAIAEAIAGVDVVFHLAWQWTKSRDARPESMASDRPDAQIIEGNVSGTSHLLAASSVHRVTRFVFTSSVAVYGPPATIHRFPITEDADVVQGDYGNVPFVQHYMAPKIAIEHMIRSYARQSGLEYVILRPSVVYGAYAPFAERLVRKTLAAPRWVSPERSREVWQMVHVDDVAQAVVLAGRKAEARNLEFNIAGSELATEEEIKMMIWEAASPEWTDSQRRSPEHARFESYEFPRYDINRAGRILGFTPQVSLREGLKEMVATVLSHPRAEATPERAEAAADPLPASERLASQPRKGGPVDTFDVRGFYDERVDSEFLAEYFEHSGFWNFGFRVSGSESPRQACENLMERLLAMIGEPRGAILDVACGNGATTAYLTRYFAPERIMAINFSARQIERAVKRAPGCHFVLMDATALAIGAEAFDHLICVEAAFHFQTRDAFLREAVRVLKPRGRLVLADAVLPPGSQTQPRANHVASAEEYRTRCLSSGFSEVAVTDVTSQTWASFAADLAHETRRKLRGGEITLRRFYEVMLWLRHLGPERYVLASCVK
jgi:MPBQ/MSBQ methyltransferase